MIQHLVIIGSGLAGYMLAKEFRKLDKESKLTVITSGDGSFYSKPLLSTALTSNKSAASLAVMTAEKMATQLDAQVLVNCCVNELDLKHREIVTTTGNIEFSHLVLACGAEKISVPLKGNALDDIYSVNNLEEYAGFREWLVDKKHLAILGSGLVGCEFANDLINSGHSVDIIAPDQYPLASFVPKPIGDLLRQAFAGHGVTWHLDRFANEVNRVDAGYAVTLSDGSCVTVDGVFSAVGLRPDIHLAKAAGLAVNKGIVVNRWLQTSESNVFALGDCAEVAGEIKQYVAPLLQCARALAKVLAGEKEPVHYPCMPVVIKTPTCPVVALPPPVGLAGEWHVEGEGDHLRALFFDEEGQLRGFALIGDKVRDKLELAKQLPVVFD